MTIWAAVNEYVTDYMDRHGQNEATRDEAHARVRELETITDGVKMLCKALNLTGDKPYDIACIAADATDGETTLILAFVEQPE